jgi:peptidoglycan/xylan/chitin deacetylase (PgdA/CDA1 family)
MNRRNIKAKSVALTAVKASAVAVDQIWRPRRGVVVLAYHRVGGRSELEVDLPTELFDRQMEAMASQGRVVTLDEALEALSRPEPPEPSGPDPVVVTFDDGTADIVDVALPILERYRIPVTLYLATDFVERGELFPYWGMPLSWSALADAVSTGLVDVGSHTHTHALLDRLGPAAVADELDRSIGLIQDHLGRPVRHFAYPKALDGNLQTVLAVRRRFASAALAGTRPNPYGRTDPHRLARSPIQVADGMHWFHRKLKGGMAAEDVLRRFLNRRRYAEATT